MGDPMKGGYALLLQISNQYTINTRNRRFMLRPGVYVYAGSALGPGGIGARIRRHLRVFSNSNATDLANRKPITKTSRNIADRGYQWHIDQLLRIAGTFATICAGSSYRAECLLIRCMKKRGFRVIVGFGSTDCSAGCRGHLVYLQEADVEKVKSVTVECFKHFSLKPIVGSTYVREQF